jgi:hypothetical protein
VTPSAYAILTFPTPGGVQRRPAMAVWRTRDGVAWVEPGYLAGDPGDPPSFHRLECGVRDYERGLILELPEGPGLAVARELVLGDEDLDPAELRPAFEAYERELEARGLTRDEEALRLEGELQADLA